MVDRNAELGERVNRLLHASVSRRTGVKIAAGLGIGGVAGACITAPKLDLRPAFAQTTRNELPGVFSLYGLSEVEVPCAKVDGCLPKGPPFSESMPMSLIGATMPRELGMFYDLTGKLHVDRSKLNPNDPNNNEAFWLNQIATSGGAQEWLEWGVNYKVITQDDELFEIPNGGQAVMSFEEAWIFDEEGRFQFDFEQRQRTNGEWDTANRYIVGFRGYFKDSGRRPLVLRTKAKTDFTDVRGHQDVHIYSGQQSGGFVSLGHADQMAAEAYSRGNERVTFVVIDPNSRTYEAADKLAGRPFVYLGGNIAR